MNRQAIVWSALAALFIAGIGLVWWLTRPLPILTVTTWPGAYGRAQAIAMLRPFGEARRMDLRIAQYDGGLDHLRHEVEAQSYDWNVVDLELPDAVEACHKGLLERVDPDDLPPGLNGTPARIDFVAGAIGPCWVGSVVFSQVVAYAPARFGANQPHAISDFFDLRRFPGPRALRRTHAKFNLEFALLADGVKPDEVYALLSTRAGLDRALAKLATLRGSIVWWTRSTEPLAMLKDGRAAMATVLNGDAFNARLQGETIGILWDRQLYELDVFGIPRGDPKARRAFDFIRYATGSEPLARTAEWVPYGPARRSSIALVGRNPELGVAMTPYLPTAPRNFATPFAVDDKWWREHEATIAPRWEAWLAEADRIQSKQAGPH